jgi:hypothetical protein
VIKIEVDTKELEQRLGNMAHKLPSVVRNIVNDLAFEIRQAEIDSLSKTFPTANPRTKKNIFVKKATKESSAARILFDQIYRRGVDEYMKPNVEGGMRTMKPSEKRLKFFYVPGAGAKLDQYGNMRGGQVTQILSRLKMFNTSGYDMNETATSRARRSGGSKSAEYFIIRQTKGGLKPGVYQRVQTAAGFGAKTTRSMQAGSYQKGQTVGKFSSVIRSRGAMPVMVFTKGTPAYKAVWPFFKVAQEVFDRRYRTLADHYISQMLQER